MTEFDWGDPAIRDMVEHNHQPTEVWTAGGELAAVFCRECGHAWPCPTVETLRGVNEMMLVHHLTARDAS